MEPLKIGVAYHSNRLFKSVREDMDEIVAKGFNSVVHMFTHNDWKRCPSVVKDIFDYTKWLGLDFSVDNWGLMGAPGDACHFLSYHPEAARMFSDGTPNSPHVCLNSPAFIEWSKEWIDKVYEMGGRSIFWDEPFLKSDKERFTCACPHCKKLFEEKYNRPMPVIPDKDCFDFQVWSIVNYFAQVTEYSNSKGMKNSVCVMAGGDLGININNVGKLALPYMDGLGTDPYWSSKEDYIVNEWVYEHVYTHTRKLIDVCEKTGKDHNLWVMAYSSAAGRERNTVYGAEAAYDAGARNIYFWGFRGCDGNEYRSANPYMHWAAVGDAVKRLWDKERDRIVTNARNKMGL